MLTVDCSNFDALLATGHTCDQAPNTTESIDTNLQAARRFALRHTRRRQKSVRVQSGVREGTGNNECVSCLRASQDLLGCHVEHTRESHTKSTHCAVVSYVLSAKPFRRL